MKTRANQERPHALAADGDPITLGEFFGEERWSEVAICGARQIEDALARC
jgi:hypothetical protein